MNRCLGLRLVFLAWLPAFAMSGLAASPAGYAEREDVKAFIGRMVATHGFEEGSLMRLFRDARRLPAVIQAIRPPADPAVRSWTRYRARFVNDDRIEGGLRFWQQNEAALRLAEARYGVPAEIVVAIIGIETIYGRNTGSFSTFSALVTLAFDYPPRAPLFLRELEELLLLAREAGRDPRSYRGSYAGALGIPQFLPSSYRNYAIDFDGDGRIELVSSARDAIGSVARFLGEHGWQNHAPIAVPARVNGADVADLIDAGIEPALAPERLAARGVTAAVPIDILGAGLSTLVDLVSPDAPTEYWLGWRNFYVLTRYNRSSFYAMAVFQLSEALRRARGE